MYAKIQDNQIRIVDRPKWLTSEGKPVGNEYLKEKGYYILLESDSKKLYASLNSTSEWIIDEENKTITKTYTNLTDEEILAKYKENVIKSLEVERTKKLYSGKVTHNQVALNTTKEAYENFHELTTLVSANKYTATIKQAVKNYMRGLDLTENDLKEISELYATHKLTVLNEANDTMDNITSATSIEQITQIVNTYLGIEEIEEIIP